MTVHDAALAIRVREALEYDQRLGGLPIDARVSGGEVFLKGRTETPEQIEIAVFIIRGVPGVRSVNVDELKVEEAA